VDQPTTAFRTVSPPAVDHPTTALKVPAAPPLNGGKTAAGSAPASTFVPLKRDDAPPAPFTPQQPPAWEAERTKQQPVPPKPPLDLLAELTNTPDTPVRVVARRFKIWTPLVVLLAIIFVVVQAVRPLPSPVLKLSAARTFTFQGGTPSLTWPGQGQSAVSVDGIGMMGTTGVQKPAPTASMAKVMTAYLILKHHPITGRQTGSMITVDKKAGQEAKSVDESTAPIKAGQRFNEKQMLELLLIPSGNNVARLFARWDAGSEAAFVKQMNVAAKSLGMSDTTYTDPSGLKSSTVSTAVDQLKLADAAMDSDVFREVVNMPQADISGVPTIYNNNRILLEPGVSGIKTGSSTPAGGNLVWSADTVVDGKDHRIYGAVMGQQSGQTPDASLNLALDRSLKLIQDAQGDVKSTTVLRKGQVVGEVDDGLGGTYAVVATKDFKAVGWAGLKIKLSLTDGGTTIPHSAKAGTKVGVLTVGEGAGQAKVPVALQKDLVEPGFGAKLTHLG
jgi:D-alanyl-D-alanine carboxypeptidase